MIILGIETSCDETAISIIEADGILGHEFKIKVLANEVLSQIAIHQQYGGVFPMIAKREHAKNLVPLLLQAFKHSDVLKNIRMSPEHKTEKTENLFYSQILKNLRIDPKREPELWAQFEKEIPKLPKPPVDAIAVTRGPGLEPALWTGINFGKALSADWDIPLIPINHMEGHVFASLLSANTADLRGTNAEPRRKEIPDIEQTSKLTNFQTYKLATPAFPAVALLISGGHTELIEMINWFEYKILGATRDDAVGEAFDKVARILGLLYPGGPEISGLAETWRTGGKKGTGIKFPRPMLKSDDFDFSFSGLKTSVLYMVKKLPELTPEIKAEIAAAFEDAVIETLVEKTRRAISKTEAKTLIVGGGVAANKPLRENLSKMADGQGAEIFISEISYSTDNALMISAAAAARFAKSDKKISVTDFGALGNWQIDNIG